MDFATTIIEWYNSNKRDLPWRNTNDPYFIWLSEIILQQTRVDQGLPYYLKFQKQFPHITNLASADEKEVLKLWQGLGYYSRARNLHITAKYIATTLNGVFPSTYAEIIKLKGVGQYTAGAIASFAFNEVQPVVDGNVFRILSRFFGIAIPIDTTIGKNYFYALAVELIDKKRPALFNQAIMEFGALQCTPKNPLCFSCPLATLCIAFEKKLITQLPIKEKKVKVTVRFFYYLIIETGKQLYIKQRINSDIWKGLYDFPLIETSKALPLDQLTDAVLLTSIVGTSDYLLKSVSEEYKHVLSHQHIYARFLTIKMNKDKKVRFKNELKSSSPKLELKHLQLHSTGSKLISRSLLEKYAIPRLIERYLQSQKLL